MLYHNLNGYVLKGDFMVLFLCVMMCLSSMLIGSFLSVMLLESIKNNGFMFLLGAIITGMIFFIIKIIEILTEEKTNKI